MQLIKHIKQACALLDAGEVIAYPTEAVYGLGCDAFNQQAVLRILNLKKRPKEKGLIVLIADWEQLWPLIDKNKVPEARFEVLKKTWPGPVTYVFPKANTVPDWITGAHEGVAIRMTAHPVARALCENGPIISTSANLAGEVAVRNIQDLDALFSDEVAGVMRGVLGSQMTVSPIYNILDGGLLRP
ncbi:MAG: threonylcarbamoyl-AMP synthase [Gammaproteobacteria bacterium]|nr:threonylcarbamoyl-AMP synthase [Gammaproteobacteria bacterium]MCH9717192.1 threonylcarbamoyl-AMP synthase [Gammaproteobacteria bacterium]MCH9763341.1 threonylcarbamoyl-AMP synthase [Gammaproteobacteria bacterium]